MAGGTNYGQSWTEISTNVPEVAGGGWKDVACSGTDATKCVAISSAADVGIRITSNFGASWTSVSYAGDGGQFWSVSTVADGSVFLMNEKDGPIHISTDSGATWAQEDYGTQLSLRRIQCYGASGSSM
jgi:hypothetical protein